MSLYDQSYFEARRCDERRLRMMAQEWRRIAALRFHCRGPVLDIGCGEGEFLQFSHWPRYGLEVSDYAKAQAIRRGVSFDLPARDEWAELVVMRGSLQHFPNPIAYLREAHRALKYGGFLAILATPDAASLCYQLFGTLPALSPPRETWFPQGPTLVELLKEIGFHDVTIRHPYWGTPYAKPLRDFGRLLTGRQPAAFPGNMMELTARK